MNKLTINYRHLAAEFIVVVLGVALALAADEWRQGVAIKAEEREYLSRISEDLEIGLEQIEGILSRFTRVQNAALVVMNFSDENENPMSLEELVPLILQSAQIGSTSAAFSHDVAYQELVSSGRLNLISSSRLRSGIRNYYRALLNLEQQREYIDRSLSQRLAELTGNPPFTFIDDPRLLSLASKQRIYSEYLSSPLVLDQIRRIHSSALLLNRNLENVRSLNRELSAELDIE
ncbi:MAG: DUF6090 family protein [Ekhidna sp.]